jgi:hypothetical protein
LSLWVRLFSGQVLYVPGQDGSILIKIFRNLSAMCHINIFSMFKLSFE